MTNFRANLMIIRLTKQHSIRQFSNVLLTILVSWSTVLAMATAQTETMQPPVSSFEPIPNRQNESPRDNPIHANEGAVSPIERQKIDEINAIRAQLGGGVAGHLSSLFGNTDSHPPLNNEQLQTEFEHELGRLAVQQRSEQRLGPGSDAGPQQRLEQRSGPGSDAGSASANWSREGRNPEPNQGNRSSIARPISPDYGFDQQRNPEPGQNSQPSRWFVPDRPNSKTMSGTEATTRLRSVARLLEQAAAELEEIQFHSDADELRNKSQQYWRTAREGSNQGPDQRGPGSPQHGSR